eukprot:3863778-Prymnesium_polylepis.1
MGDSNLKIVCCRRHIEDYVRAELGWQRELRGLHAILVGVRVGVCQDDLVDQPVHSEGGIATAAA